MSACAYTPPRQIFVLDLLCECYIKYVAMVPGTNSTVPIRIICRGVLSFVTGCFCSIWSRGSTSCSLYAGSPFNKPNYRWMGLLVWCSENVFFFIMYIMWAYVFNGHIDKMWERWSHCPNSFYFHNQFAELLFQFFNGAQLKKFISTSDHNQVSKCCTAIYGAMFRITLIRWKQVQITSIFSCTKVNINIFCLRKP